MNRFSMSFFIVAVLFVISAKTFAGKGTEIKITVKGLGNTQLILANYYGDKQYIKDTFLIDKTGTFVTSKWILFSSGNLPSSFSAIEQQVF
jgi:hypothetical protein